MCRFCPSHAHVPTLAGTTHDTTKGCLLIDVITSEEAPVAYALIVHGDVRFLVHNPLLAPDEELGEAIVSQLIHHEREIAHEQTAQVTVR